MTDLGLGGFASRSWRGRVVMGVAVALSLAPRSGTAAPPAAVSRLVVLNYSGYFSDRTLDEHFRAKLGEATLAHLGKSPEGVWLFMFNASLKNGSNYCFAGIGLTEAPPKGRSARIPAQLSWGASRSNTRGSINDAQLNACMSDALDAGTQRFALATLESNLKDIDRTRDKGTRKSEAPSKDTAQLFSKGISETGSEGIFEVIPATFRAAFDYRKLQWAALATRFDFGEQVVCIGVAGVAGRAPLDRHPRLPGMRYLVTRELTVEQSKVANAGQTCADDVAAAAVRDALAETWDDQGLLKDLKSASETGVAPVTNFRRPTESAATADLAQFRRSLKVGSDSHCGLVTEVRPPIAKVQTLVGERWLKTAQLYPQGRRNCRFVNGVYQDSE